MSNNRENQWDNEDEDFEDVPQYRNQNDDDFVNKLRRDNRALTKQLKEISGKFEELNKSQKERIIKEVLTSKGVRPSIAKYIPSDIEATPEAVNSWLTANAEDFGIEINSPKKEVDSETVESMKKINSATSGAEGTPAANSIESRLLEANTEEAIMALIRGEQ